MSSTHIHLCLDWYVPCESVNHTASRSHDRSCSKKQTDEREPVIQETSEHLTTLSELVGIISHEKAYSTGIIASSIFEDLNQRTGRRVDNLVNISTDEEQDNQKDGSCHRSDNHSANHNLRPLCRGLWDLCVILSVTSLEDSTCAVFKYLQSCEPRHPVNSQYSFSSAI